MRSGLHPAGRTLCRVAGKRPGDLHRTNEDYLRSMGEMKFFDQMTVHQHGSHYSGDDQSYTDDDIAAAIGGVILMILGQVIFLHAPTRASLVVPVALDLIGAIAFACGLNFLAG